MKTFKVTITKTKYVFMALLVVFAFSCSTEDGQDGAPGAQGPTGLDGSNGQDGNANVQTYTFDTSTINSNNFEITFPQLTQDVLDNDAILTYLKRDNGAYYAIPGISFDDMTEVELLLNTLNIYFYNKNNGTTIVPPVGRYESVKAIIIKSTSTGNRVSTMQNALQELISAGIDVNNYYSVCDYYGIPY